MKSSQQLIQTELKVIRESVLPKCTKVQGEIISSTVTSGVSIPDINPRKLMRLGWTADPEPCKCKTNCASKCWKIITCVLLLDQTQMPMDDESHCNSQPNVHENLKLITRRTCHQEKPKAHSGSILSQKISYDTTVTWDHFFMTNQPEDDQE
ncbi:hypothetical protein Tco_0435332 [Tanacetum coccineum]